MIKSSCYGLAMHTASPELGLAISNFAGDRRSQTWNLGRETSQLLHSHLVEFLQPQTWQDLEFIAVAKGPGGFTGTRIGVVTARTLAQQLAIPLFAVSTLAGVAWDVGKTLVHPDADIAVQMPARRGEFFCAIYRLKPVGQVEQQENRGSPAYSVSPVTIAAVLPDQVRTLEDWQTILSEWNGFYYPVKLDEGASASVMSILEIAYSRWLAGDRPHWSAALPFYGQHPVRA
ncbi:MAG: tRNA (adenosine(37)-N6)-threonylcarbamoyltransferase complex dimerization subunit type 1 TsaB [Leptodesmis sp.]|uniref:tRNA (adenosine(37)-N6)-threonylcarbamoyltransferase complex dimerization subunit type 1 TsaB n=1 Tax=Leptodesmis sp. TaxID=3100501 RepID=UPI003D10DAC3